MPATIVQMGHKGPIQPPAEGGLFQDVKFFVSKQVPTILQYKQIITDNGGTIVLSEDNADIKIGDHLKAATFSGKGFTSYTFLDACMNEKTLVDLERYAIKKPEPNRVAAKGKPRAGQATRTFFGDEDDLILFQKITQPGVKTSGYAVYQELAAEHPNHPVNGWRGRWVDFYAKRNPDPHHWYNLLQDKLGITTLPEDPRINNNAPLPPKKKAKLSTTSTKTATSGTAQPMPAAMGKRNVRDAAHPKPRPASSEFSAEDDKLLETLGIALALLPPAAHGGLWEEFQDKNSHHSMRKWKQRYDEISKGSTSRPPVAREPIPEAPSAESHTSASSGKSTKSKSDQKFPPDISLTPMRLNRSPSHVGSGTANYDVQTTLLSANREKPASPAQPPSTPPRTELKSLKRKRISTPVSRLDREIPSTPDERIGVINRRTPSPELGTINSSGHLNVAASSPPNTVEQQQEPSVTAQPATPAEDNKPGLDDVDDALDTSALSIPELVIPSSQQLSSSIADDYDPDDLAHPRNSDAGEAWMNRLYQEDDVPWHRIIYALRRTMFSRRLSELVIECMKKGEPLPVEEGVWTEEEDAILMGQDSKEIDKLAKTRGKEEVDRRIAWLLDPENADDGTFEEEEKQYLEEEKRKAEGKEKGDRE